MARPSLGVSIFIVGEDERLWDEEARQARATGAEHLVLYLEYPPGNGRLRERQIRRLRNAIRWAKLLVQAPTSWPSLITPHEELLRLSLQELKETLFVAANLGAALVILHGGSNPFPYHRQLHDAGARFSEGVRELLPLAREIGLALAVENLARGYPATAEELEEALALGLKLSLALDQASEGGQDLLALLERFSARAVHVAVGPQEEALVAPLRESGFTGFLTLGFSAHPRPDRWAEVREFLARVKASWDGV